MLRMLAVAAIVALGMHSAFPFLSFQKLEPVPHLRRYSMSGNPLTQSRSRGRLLQRLTQRAISEWRPVLLPPRTVETPPAVRIALSLPSSSWLDNRDIHLRITEVFDPAATHQFLEILRSGVHSEISIDTYHTQPILVLGAEIDWGVVAAALEDVQKKQVPVFVGSVCLFRCPGQGSEVQFGIVLNEGFATSGCEAVPIGAVADPMSLRLLLGLAQSTHLQMSSNYYFQWRIVDVDEKEMANHLQAHLAPYQKLSEELVSCLYPFPLDVMDPMSNPNWNPRLWLQCFQPEVLPALREIMGYTCTPPFPWGHHFFSQILLRQCSHLEGDVVELGVAAGGTSVFLAQLAASAGKKFVCVDSFEGLPSPRVGVDNAHFKKGDFGPLEDDGDLLQMVDDYCRTQGVRESMVIIKSLFSDLETLPSEHVCFAHLDSDLYDSIMSSLELVYDRLVPMGVIVVDDFFMSAQGPARAVSDFFAKRGGPPPLLYPIPPYAVAIQKGQHAPSARLSCVLDGNYYSFEWLRASDAFLACAEASRARLLAQLQHPTTKAALERKDKRLLQCLHNAERMVTFLRGSTLSEAHGSEVLEYLSCLELWTEQLQRTRPSEPLQIPSKL